MLLKPIFWPKNRDFCQFFDLSRPPIALEISKMSSVPPKLYNQGLESLLDNFQNKQFFPYFSADENFQLIFAQCAPPPLERTFLSPVTLSALANFYKENLDESRIVLNLSLQNLLWKQLQKDETLAKVHISRCQIFHFRVFIIETVIHQGEGLLNNDSKYSVKVTTKGRGEGRDSEGARGCLGGSFGIQFFFCLIARFYVRLVIVQSGGGSQKIYFISPISPMMTYEWDSQNIQLLCMMLY